MNVIFAHGLLAIPLVWVFDAFLSIFNAFDSGVHHVEEHWWNERQLEHKDVLVRQLRSAVESSQNLVWSELVGVVVGMSLDAEGDLGADGVPGVEVADCLIDTFLVLQAHEAIVLQVIAHFLPEDTKNSVCELEANATITKEVIDGHADCDVNCEVMDHLVLG